MTLLLKPRGPGNWAITRLVLTGRRADPLLVQRGTTFNLGGIVWRVVEIQP